MYHIKGGDLIRVYAPIDFFIFFSYKHNPVLTMCGRFCCSLAPKSLITKLQEDKVVSQNEIEWREQEKYHPSYNVCPSKYIVTMYQDIKTKQLVLHSMVIFLFLFLSLK